MIVSTISQKSILFSIVQPITLGVVIAICVIIILLFMSALASASEIAYFSLSPAAIEKLKKSKIKSAKRVLKLLEKPKRLLATILIVNNFINVGIVIISSFIINKLFDFSTSGYMMIFIIQVLAVTFVILLLGEVIPKVYATKNPLRLSKFMSNPLRISDIICAPISSLLVSGTRIIDKRIKKRGGDITVDKLSLALELTEEAEPDEQKILEGIVKFGNTDAKQIMKPRIDVFAFNQNTPFADLIPGIIKSGFSRIPVYKESFDNIIGVLYIKDLLPYLNHSEFDWIPLLRAPFFVPENKKIDDLLKEFQEKKVHLAFVVDEYGGTSGIVSLEDILEEIVGEITDEFDSEDIVYTKVDASNYIFEGKTALNDIYRILDIDGDDFEEVKGESDSIGGFLIEQWGKIPLKNETFDFKNYTFTVEVVDNKRVKRIKITVNSKVEKQ